MVQYIIPEDFLAGFKLSHHYPNYINSSWDIAKGFVAQTISHTDDNCTLEIGSHKYSIPKELIDFVVLVESSKQLLSLGEGWDEMNAQPITQNIWQLATCFLIDYVLYCYRNYDTILQLPEINPVANGSIDLSWRTGKGRMLINIRENLNDVLAYFYGDLYNNRSPIKGNVSANETAQYLAIWMKNFLA